MKKTRKWLSILLAVSTVAGMTACSSGGSGTATTAAKAATTAAKATTAAPATAKATAAAAKAAATTAAAGQASSQKRSKLKLYLWSSSADTLKKSGVIEDFQSKYPYDVEVTTSEFDSLENTALMMHTTGQDCDVLQVNNSSVATFVEAGMLENLDDWIKSSKLDLSSYAQAAVDIGMVDGKHYSLPYDVDCRILAYNKNILKECGMTEKDLATTDGVLAFGKTANQKGYYAMAGQVSKNVFCIYDLGGFMLCWGVRLYEKDGNNYKSQLTKPEVADYMKWAVEMYQYMPKDTNIDDTMARSMFAEGKVAMLWWTPSQVKSVLPKFKNPDDVGFLTMPKAPNGKSGSAMGGYLFGVSQNAPNKNAAHAWMEYVNKPENMAKITRGLPADTKAFDFKPYNDKLYEKFKEQYKTATFPVPLTPIYTEVAETWNTLYDKALMKEISIEDAIKQGDKAVQDKLDTLKK